MWPPTIWRLKRLRRCGSVEVEQIKGKKIMIAPILRAGLGMMDGVLENIPNAWIGVVSIYRDEEILNFF